MLIGSRLGSAIFHRPENGACHADAISADVSGDQRTPAAACGSSDPGASKPSSTQFDQLLQMHTELLTMVGALLEQNAIALGQISQVTDDFDAEPKTYLDGTPV